MKTLFRFCITINTIFFLFGFLVIGFNITGGEWVRVGGGWVRLDYDLNNIIVTVIASVIGLAFAGLQIFGSGLQDTSVKIIKRVLLYSLLWTIISIFSYDLFILIPEIGNFLYILLTIGYAISFLMMEVELK